MRVADLNWMQLEAHLERDDRIVLPLGCTEQHAYLSLATDSILAERVSIEAAEPLAVPVLPVLPYGLTPYFAAFPGSPTHHWWKAPRTLAVVREIDPDAGHASWMENFPWTRLAGVALPPGKKAPSPRTSQDPDEVRAQLQDGSFGGFYERPHADLVRVWETGVAETREALENA